MKVLLPAIAFPEPDPILEATGDSPTRRAQRANRAAQDVLKDRNAAERTLVQQLNTRLLALRSDLTHRLLSDPGSVTDFKRFNVNALIAETDRLIADTQRQLALLSKPVYGDMADLGSDAADEPMKAAQLKLAPGMPGLDSALVNMAFDNTLELLTAPMQQFGSDVKVALRKVALAGEDKFAEIAKLRDTIGGKGFQAAQFKAERIIRTELGRIFNESNYTRLATLAKELPFLRKGWRAATDSRTRKGHKEAGITYARGQGIPMADRFRMNVYNERPGKPVTLLGVATLRFPIDPQAQPAGRLAAGATIMCRCNAFVDFDLSAFAQFSQQQIQLALGGPKPPLAPGPEPVPPALPKVPRKRRTVVPKPVIPKAIATPPPTDVAPIGPGTGTKVSAALVPPKSGPLADLHRKVTALIDKVHSDGDLWNIPLKGGGGKMYGQYRGQVGGQALDIKITVAGQKAHPINTLIHEIGHWLDHQVINPGLGGGRRGDYASVYRNSPLMQQWSDAAKASPTYQQLRRWRSADARPGRAFTKTGPVPAGKVYDFEGDGVIPKGLTPKHLTYLVSSEETFARSYAQYVVMKGGDPAALAELRLMQKAASYGPVKADAVYNRNPLGTEPLPNSWDYPTVWQDDEFAPIAKAFDAIFEKLEWRTAKHK